MRVPTYFQIVLSFPKYIYILSFPKYICTNCHNQLILKKKLSVVYDIVHKISYATSLLTVQSNNNVI